MGFCVRKYTAILATFVVCFIIEVTQSIELTFELPDNSEECYYEKIPKDTEVVLEYEVIVGGNYDIDVKVIDQYSSQVLYDQKKKTSEQFRTKSTHDTEFAVCFSNEFSTFTHKIIYFNLEVGDEDPLPGVGEHFTAMTQMESSSQKIHEDLNSIVDYQTHHRLRESHGRKRAEELNERVLIWAFAETIGILVITIGQVMILKNFFSDKKPPNAARY